MKGKSSYCVQDTSGISKTILKREKYDLWITAKITESGIGPLGISRTLTVPACISGSGYLGPGSLALSQLSSPSPGFRTGSVIQVSSTNFVPKWIFRQCPSAEDHGPQL